MVREDSPWGAIGFRVKKQCASAQSSLKTAETDYYLDIAKII